MRSNFVSKTRTRLRWALRLSLSALLLGYAVHRVDHNALYGLVARVDWPVWSLGFALQALSPLLAAMRLTLLLRKAGSPVTWSRVVAINLESKFFSLVFPGDVAGGVIRWARIGAHLGSRISALSYVMIERLLDLMVLGALAALGAPLLAVTAAGLRWWVLALGIVVFGASVVILLASGLEASLASAHRHATIEPSGLVSRIRRSVGAGIIAAATIVADSALLVRLMGWTLLSSVVGFVGSLIMARSVVATLPATPSLSALAAVDILAQFPITINGLGLREVTLPALLSRYGVTPETGVIIGLSLFMPSLVLGTVGAVLNLKGAAKPNTETGDASS